MEEVTVIELDGGRVEPLPYGNRLSLKLNHFPG
jgi:hypothetical protein